MMKSPKTKPTELTLSGAASRVIKIKRRRSRYEKPIHVSVIHLYSLNFSHSAKNNQFKTHNLFVSYY